MSQPDECLALLPILEKYGIKQVTMHARLGEQQYKGEVDMEAFSAFYEACSLPLVYNGDVQTVDDLQRISEQFPKLSGIMVGRGLLAHPELAMEYQTGKVLSDSEKMALYSRLHSVVYSHYQERLNGGEPQILDKMKEFWEYFYPEMDKKRRKAIKKATSISKYEASVVFWNGKFRPMAYVEVQKMGNNNVILVRNVFCFLFFCKFVYYVLTSQLEDGKDE